MDDNEEGEGWLVSLGEAGAVESLMTKGKPRERKDRLDNDRRSDAEEEEK